MLSPLVRSMTIDPASTKPFQVTRQSAVENEYVPSPENSPKFSNHRHRASTVSNPAYAPEAFQFTRVAQSHLQPSHNSTPEMLLRNQSETHTQEEDSPSHLTHKHLSMVSMESGLSFGYDVEKDFNPSQPLEAQPWFHGKIPRGDAEAHLHDDGDFLVRENTTMSNTFTLTLRWRGVADHTLIGTTEVISTTSLIQGSTVKYQFDSGAFDSVPELIYNHLKYQIPIDKAQHTLITNPVCRPGNHAKPGLYTSNVGVYAPPPLHQRGSFSPESSPCSFSLGGNSFRRRSNSPSSDTARFHSLRKPAGVYNTPPPERLSKHLSIGDLLEASKEEVEVSLRKAFSPPPDNRLSHIGASAGYGHPAAAGNQLSVPAPENGHQRVESFGDYEVMESVSILKESPSLARKSHTPQPQQPDNRDIYRTQSVSAGNTLSRPRTGRERVQYAEIRYPKDGGPGVVVKPGGPGIVNYAEVKFARSNTVSNQPRQPHPFAVYDTIPRREATPPQKQETTPYQSRADVMAQRLLSEPTYSTPNPSLSSQRPASARPLTNYATIQFPMQHNHSASSLPSTHDHTHLAGSLVPDPQKSSHVPGPQHSTNGSQHSSHNPSPLSSHNPSPQLSSRVPLPQQPSHIPITQTDTTLYSLPNKKSRKTQELHSSSDSLLSSGSHHTNHSNSPTPKHVMGASLIRSHSTSLKVHKGLPGYETLVKAHTILQNNSNDELAYHMTRTDAMTFLLAPRPGEDRGIWKER